MKGHIKLVNWAAYISLIIVAVILCVCLFWLIWPYKVVTMTDLKILTEQTQVGGEIAFQMHVHKYTNHTALTNISLQDGAFYSLSSGNITSPPGDFDTARTVLVNQAVPSGKYHLVITAKYQVNPIKSVTVIVKSDNIVEVINGHLETVEPF
jgi:hypothetical protein